MVTDSRSAGVLNMTSTKWLLIHLQLVCRYEMCGLVVLIDVRIHLPFHLTPMVPSSRAVRSTIVASPLQPDWSLACTPLGSQ